MRRGWYFIPRIAGVALPLLLLAPVAGWGAATGLESATTETAVAGETGSDGGSSAMSPLAGDDQVPTSYDAESNPYLTLQKGAANAGSVTEAYVPPPVKMDANDRAKERLSDLLNVLGPDIFNQRVNIATPPDTEVAEVVRLLAERAKLNFIYADGVIRGRVTLNLKDVPLGVALQGLLASQDLAIIREGENVLRIVPRKEIQPGTVETRTISIKLNWVPAETMATTLKGFAGGTASAVNNVKAHKESNTVIITDTPANVALLRDLVTQLDVPEKQVMIEARLAELVMENGRQLGSKLTVETNDASGNSPTKGTLSGNSASVSTKYIPTFNDSGQVTGITKDVTAVPAQAVQSLISNLSGQPTNPTLSFGTVLTIFGREYDVAGALDGLESKSIITTLANPRVITLNNQDALIDITRKIPYIEAQQGASQNQTAATVKFEEVGVKLAVTPTITNNGFIRMRLEPEQKILSGEFFNPTTLSDVPIVAKRTAITNVIVRDEETVVLGGLRQMEGVDSKSQYPWFGEVPVLGWFMKRSTKGHIKNDLMLFVTPHIVKAPVLTPAESYKWTRIDAHWDLPDYFFDDTIGQREATHRGTLDSSAKNYYPSLLKLPPVSEDASGEGNNQN
ncbi:MAG: hypothetical protein K1X53_01840 [Candidatus Sumerlaeaceae bacterium]|nr:hypothetical protein [Candidatus Sumerlaeaceae bacterium]